jgi:hypothetical protein
VFSFSNLLDRLASLAIIQPYLSITPNCNQVIAIGTELSAVNELVVLSAGTGVELEGRTMEKAQVCVITTSGSSYRPLLANAHANDLLVVSADLAHRVSRVGCDAVTKPLPAIADGDDPLAIAIPSNVVDATSNDRVFPFRLLCSCCVPNANRARDISRGDVKAGWRKTRNCGCSCVLSVLFCDRRIIYGADKD